ncbi:hypothetical protein BDZ91DRAFT_792092 [Kalaharituber pfeilii]|nr:hypothetical protein BDZ91DRAFT_792092 [Kalaharituber pfeilii]
MVTTRVKSCTKKQVTRLTPPSPDTWKKSKEGRIEELQEQLGIPTESWTSMWGELKATVKVDIRDARDPRCSKDSAEQVTYVKNLMHLLYQKYISGKRFALKMDPIKTKKLLGLIVLRKLLSRRIYLMRAAREKQGRCLSPVTEVKGKCEQSGRNRNNQPITLRRKVSLGEEIIDDDDKYRLRPRPRTSSFTPRNSSSQRASLARGRDVISIESSPEPDRLKAAMADARDGFRSSNTQPKQDQEPRPRSPCPGNTPEAYIQEIQRNRSSYGDRVENLCLQFSLRFHEPCDTFDTSTPPPGQEDKRYYLWLADFPCVSTFLKGVQWKGGFTNRISAIQIRDKFDVDEWFELPVQDYLDNDEEPQLDQLFRENLLKNLLRRPGNVYEGFIIVYIDTSW